MSSAVCKSPDTEVVAKSVVGPTEAIADAREASGRSTYRQILRSSALIGGSSGLNLLIGIVRTKAMAILLGPAGFGLMGAFTSIADLARSVAEMGINSSGVRQIAEAAGSEDAARIGRTLTVLRRTAIALGLLGAVALAAFCRPIAMLTFGDDHYAASVALLALALFFRLVADGQGAALQGMRRIGDLARVGVLGALLGTAVSIPIVYWLREQGVALSLVAVAAMSLLVSWWYSRKVKVTRPSLSMAEVRHEAKGLLHLGLAFMASGLLTLGAAYIVRTFLIRHNGLAEAGLYQSAWTIGGMYVSFILQAMGADFYPRLVGAFKDRGECNRLVNEQAHISILLASTGVIATLTLAPIVLHVFYSRDFAAAAAVLRWICLGMTLRVVTWPMGYIIIASGQRKFLIGTELAWAVAYLSMSWLLISRFGLNGAGMAFFLSYVAHGAIVYPVARKLTGFRWSIENLRTACLMVIAVVAVSAGFFLLSDLLANATGLFITALCCVYTVRTLVRLTSPDLSRIPVLRLLRRKGSRSKNQSSTAA